MTKRLLLLGLLFVNPWASAQVIRPEGPPWTPVCAEMEQASLRTAFKTDACFQSFMETFDAHTPMETTMWMHAHASCFAQWAHFSWLAFTKPGRKMAEVAWLHQLYMTHDRLLQDSAPCDTNDAACPGKRVEALLTKGLTQEITADSQQYTKTFLKDVAKNKAFKSKMDVAFAAVGPLCLAESVAGCSGAFNKALQWMYPRVHEPEGAVGSITFSLLPFLESTFTDTLTQKYASALALKLLGATPQMSDEALQGATFYPMALEAFHGDTDRLWAFLAVYSTRGAAWASGYKLAHEETKPLFAALMVISAAMGYWDSVYFESQKAFSYSDGSTLTCAQPKPYHFWMTASFVHLLIGQGYSAKAAQVVARLLGASYEFGSDTFGRNPDDIYYLEPFATPVNRARREMTHHYLGAQFAGTDVMGPVPFDETLSQVMKAAKPLPELTREEMEQRIGNPLTKWKYWQDLTGYRFKLPAQ